MRFHFGDRDRTAVGIAQPNIGPRRIEHRRDQAQTPSCQRGNRDGLINGKHDEREADQVQQHPRDNAVLEDGILLAVNQRPVGALGRFEPDGLPDRQRRRFCFLCCCLVGHRSTVNGKVLAPGKGL